MTLTWGDFLSSKDVRIEEYIPKDIQELLFPNPSLEAKDETTNEERNELNMMAKMYPASLGSEQDEIVQFSYMRKRQAFSEKPSVVTSIKASAIQVMPLTLELDDIVDKLDVSNDLKLLGEPKHAAHAALLNRDLLETLSKHRADEMDVDDGYDCHSGRTSLNCKNNKEMQEHEWRTIIQNMMKMNKEARMIDVILKLIDTTLPDYAPSPLARLIVVEYLDQILFHQQQHVDLGTAQSGSDPVQILLQRVASSEYCQRYQPKDFRKMVRKLEFSRYGDQGYEYELLFIEYYHEKRKQ